jgi:translation initiation factor IF-3
MVLHGREQAFGDQAKTKIEDFIAQLNQFGKVEQDVKKEGRNLYAIMKPN